MLSYDQVKRRVSSLSGVLTWQHDMCVDSCVGFTGLYARLEECPRCQQPRYDPEKLAKSNGRTKVPQKSFTTFPIGPQLQSRWKNPRMAQKMHYRRKKTEDIFRDRDRCPASFSPTFTTPRYRQHRSLTRSPSSLNYPCLSRIIAHPSIPQLSHVFPQLSRVFPQSCRAFPHVAHSANRAWSLVRSSSPCDCIPLSSQSFPLSPLYI